MGDLYVDKGLRTDGNGNIWVDSQTGKVGVQDYAEPKKIGTMNPDFNMGFSNTFSYKGINLGVVLTARVGGLDSCQRKRRTAESRAGRIVHLVPDRV